MKKWYNINAKSKWLLCVITFLVSAEMRLIIFILPSTFVFIVLTLNINYTGSEFLN